ncbi:uncharacterized protein N7482_008574 [Penicillium canariense]|uniref:Ima1 N-terminal domain-containing protein n=1 Tax=Penicillium canariense TaxID=189055 RepID=A0A9W9HYN7_9EURO|nr:uncharacterized protein N7482_008574 [Penicillium canariense]KAJ5157474.1 hypothetical protein N7482_008574 [Penicillium canariense]
MALFSKRLTCFYCGRRASQPVRGPVRKFHCEHCEADNYLDQNGDITDPPAEDTNRTIPGPDVSSPPFGSTDFTKSNLFCSQCIRNQHLFRTSLAGYFPPSDDPTDAEYERGYEQFKKGLENTYPQVCDACEPGVREEIRKKGYEAKADHLRRMMDRSRASKALRQVRDRSWQSLLVYAGAFGYWTSVGGQLAWDVTSALTSPYPQYDLGMSSDEPVSVLSCVRQAVLVRRLPSECSFDLAPTAGIALVAGSLSLWWNPKLRMKIEGKNGRFAGLGEYYQVQLIALVARCVFWALLKDPSASGLEPTLPPALHIFMIIFTLLSVVISRRVVDYNTRPLVDWSDDSWEKPLRSAGASPIPGSSASRSNITPRPASGPIDQRFPLERLTSDLPSARKSPAFPTPPPEVDEMEWTPSAPQPIIQPTVSVYQRNQPSVFDGPSPFTGSLPAAPKPPAWNLRAQTSTKPIEQVVQPNPFHKSPSNPPKQWQANPLSPEPAFRPPTFFPTSDFNTSTGLETLFERAFDIDPEGPKRDWNQSTPNQKPYIRPSSRLVFQYLRLALLLGSMAAWTFSQNHQLSIPGNYIEACALGSASLIAGFALLEAVKRPLAHWNGMEILVYITELAAAVHLGAHLPQASYEREYFDRYGKLLLIFMAVQEGLGVLASYKEASTLAYPENHQSNSPMIQQPVSPQPSSPQLSSPHQNALAWSPTHSTFSSPPPAPSIASHSEAPSLSFATTAGSSSFSSGLSSTLPPAPNYRIPSSQSVNRFPSPRKNPHSFTMSDLRENDPPSDYDQDSDNETVATTATTMTDATTRNIRYGRYPNSEYNSPFSPRRNELGPGIGGLSLEDRPASRRITRSQTQQGLMGRRLPGRAIR